MAISDFDQPPTYPISGETTQSGEGGEGGGSPIAEAFPILFPLVLGSAFILSLVLAFLILWLNRRRAKAAARAAAAAAGDEEVPVISPDGSSARPSQETKGTGGTDTNGSGTATTTRRKLQKACSVGAGPGWWAKEGSGLLSDDEDGEGRGWPRRHVSMPLIPRPCTKGHFHFGLGDRSESCRWPGQAAGEVEMEEVGRGRRRKTPSWIDEDLLHGPRVSTAGRESLLSRRKTEGALRKTKSRGSWPLRNRVPTLPRVHHTIHGYPYFMTGARDGSSEALLNETQVQKTTATGMDYAQLRAFSRILPAPPKPALVANRDRRVIKPSVSMGYVYGASKIPQPVLSPPASPVRSTPTTPLRHRGRQRSTDSTLSDILRSTEKRLREGSVSGTIRSRRATTSPTRASPGKMFGPREYGISVSHSRTPSPKKTVSSQVFTPGHRRQNSQQSVSSETDSLVGEESLNPHVPSGLTSPSRSQKNPESEKPLLQAQSVRTSLSSELSTLYSEDEMPDEVKRAIMPLEGLVVQPQQAANVRPPSMNDPFVTTGLPLSGSRPSSIGSWPTRPSKSQALLRQSVQRSQRLRSMTVGHIRAQSQGLILAPGPVIYGPRPAPASTISPSRKMSVTVPPSIQPYIASRASEPPPSPTRLLPTNQSPTGPLFVRLTKTSTLSTIPLLPPPLAPGVDNLTRTQHKSTSPIKAAQTSDGQQQPVRRSPTLMLPSTERSSTPPSPTRRVGGELRLSLVLAPKQLQELQRPNQNRSSVCSSSSSVYSQETSPSIKPTTSSQAAMALNRAGFLANSSLYPAPLSPRGRAPSPSKLSSELVVPNDDDDNNDSNSNNNNNNTDKDVNEKDEEEEDDDEDTPLALTTTIASLRRMNSGMSSASSLRSIADRNASPSPSPSPERVPGPAIMSPLSPLSAAAAAAAAAGDSPAGVMGGGAGYLAAENPLRNSNRKSIGARNYYILGNGAGQRQSRRMNRVVSCGVVGVGGIVKHPGGSASGGGVGGSGNDRGASSPYKRRRPGSVHHQRRSSNVLTLSRSEFSVGGGREGKENDGGDGMFKVAAGEFTFEVNNPNISGKGGLGLREGSSGSVNALVMPQQNDSQRLSLAWKPAEGSTSRNGSPVRSSGSPSRGSLRSVVSLGLYDRQGFLISASPVRGASPSGLRV